MALKPLKEQAKKVAKAYGDEAGGLGFKFPQFARMPTGILTLDLMLAGGWPLGCMSLLWGAESSGKSSLCFRIAAEYQRRFPDLKVCWLDIEDSYDEEWALRHKLKHEDVYLYKPNTAEEAADISKELAFSSDAGLIVVDSLAAMASLAQLEKSAEDAVVAGAAGVQTRMIRNLGSAATAHTKHGQPLTVICINQPRVQIGGYTSGLEILPGPRIQHFQAFLKLRLTGKPFTDNAKAAVPIYLDVEATIKKKKFPCIRTVSKWQMALHPFTKHSRDFKLLDVNNHYHMEQILNEFGWLTKGKKDWTLEATGEVFDTKTAAIDAAMDDYDFHLNWMVQEFLGIYEDEIKDWMESDEAQG